MQQPELYLIVPFISLVLSQLIKFSDRALRSDIDFSYLIRRGSWPNSLAAVVGSKVITAGLVDGWRALLIALASVFGLWIVNRALKGSLGNVLEALVKKFTIAKDDGASTDRRRNWLIGGVVGAVVAIVMSSAYWSESVQWLFEVPTRGEAGIYLAIMGGLYAVGQAGLIMFNRRRTRRLPTASKIRRALRYSIVGPAIFGVVFAIIQRGRLGIFEERFYTAITVLWMIIASLVAYWLVYRHAPGRLEEETEHFIKEKKAQKSARKSKRKRRK